MHHCGLSLARRVVVGIVGNMLYLARINVVIDAVLSAKFIIYTNICTNL